MRWLTVLLFLVLVGVQYPLWFGRGGWLQVRALERQLQTQLAENEGMAQRNERLAGEVNSLQNGAVALEERARYDLGLVKKDEVFVQFVASGKPVPVTPVTQSLVRQHGRLFTQPERVVPEPPSRSKPKSSVSAVSVKKKTAHSEVQHKKKVASH